MPDFRRGRLWLLELNPGAHPERPINLALRFFLDLH
jgi:hypothetical protein